MRFASGFIPDEERLYSVECPHSTETYPRDEEIRAPQRMSGFRFFWRASKLPLWPLLAICAVLVAMVFICFRHRVKSLAAEVSRRRLAKEDTDFFESPPSPELEQLCIMLGPWNPAETSSGGPRQSPHMVQEFFAEIETEEESWAALPVPADFAKTDNLAGAAMKWSAVEPPGPSAGCLDEKSGPREIFPTLKGLPQGLQRPVPPPASVTASPAARRHGKKTFFLEARLRAIKPKHVSAGQMPESNDTPSASEAMPSPQSTSTLYLPPLVRLPALDPGVTPFPWKKSIFPNAVAPFRSFQGMLRAVREMLLLPSLDAQAAKDLVIITEELAAYAMQRLRPSTKTFSPSDAVRAYGLRLLILNSLHSAAQAIGPPTPPWWSRFTDSVLKNHSFEAPMLWRFASSSNVALAQDLVNALRQYRDGCAPTLEEVAELESLLSRNQKTAFYFQPPR